MPLTAPEALQYVDELVSITQQIRASLEDGVLSREERRALARELLALSAEIALDVLD